MLVGYLYAPRYFTLYSQSFLVLLISIAYFSAQTVMVARESKTDTPLKRQKIGHRLSLDLSSLLIYVSSQGESKSITGFVPSLKNLSKPLRAALALSTSGLSDESRSILSKSILHVRLAWQVIFPHRL
jgi:hypothetical protein